MTDTRYFTDTTSDPIAFINARLTDLAEANALYGKDQRLNAPDKIARNDREISWLKDLRTVIVMLGVAQRQPEPFTPAEAWDNLVNKDDRTSPEEYPDHC